jgi:hypothetical protein
VGSGRLRQGTTPAAPPLPSSLVQVGLTVWAGVQMNGLRLLVVFVILAAAHVATTSSMPSSDAAVSGLLLSVYNNTAITGQPMWFACPPSLLTQLVVG